MKSILRYSIIVLLSPLVAALPYAIIYMLFESTLGELSIVVFIVAYAIGFLSVVFLGIPLHCILQKLKKYEARHYLIPGFLLPCVVTYVLGGSMFNGVLFFGLSGLVVSGVFWWLAVRKNPFSSNKLRA